MSDDLVKQLISDFIVESHEGLERYEQEILQLEKGEADVETLNNIFRVIHTVKGTAGCLGLPRMEKIAHVGENLLTMVRDGETHVTEEMITPLLKLSDVLLEMLKELESSGTEGEEDYSDLINTLEALQNSSAGPIQETSEGFGLFEEEPEKDSIEVEEPIDQPKCSLEEEGKDIAEPQDWGMFGDDEPECSAPVSEEEKEPMLDLEAGSASPVESDPSEAPAKRETSGAKAASGGAPSAVKQSIRVDVGHLDKVMNMVGELVLARNQIVANAEQLDPAALLTASQRLNIITTELQEGVMKTRMQPIGSIWGSLPRVVRDVSGELGKKVRLVMDGQSTELDRTVIEAIKDPLTHILRNSIDHGIESPDVRRAAGKAEEGLLSLRAFHEGGQVNIEIMDDGNGINIERVKAKALEQGLVKPDEASRMSEREAIKLIFMPGLSSAEKISNISGRGVGMDVVKTNVEKAGGSIDIHTQPGQGTTIRIRIPLTLAIIPALIVTSGGNRFAIPQVSLLELVRLEGEEAKSKIERLYGAPVYRLRGQLLPLAWLKETLRLDSEENSESDVVNIVVLEADGSRFGLVVDDINDTEEIVVKPLSKQLKDIKTFSGATIMGDGKVALILDVLGYAAYAKVISENEEKSIGEDENAPTEFNEEKESLLVFKVGSDRTLAIPLSLAARLEEFTSDQIERTGTQQVVQYRDQIMPLIKVSDYIDSSGSISEGEAELLQVVVYSENGRSVGLVVDRINDIVEECVKVRRPSVTPGILGSAVIQEKVTDLLDVEDIVRRADPGFFATTAA